MSAIALSGRLDDRLRRVLFRPEPFALRLSLQSDPKNLC